MGGWVSGCQQPNIPNPITTTMAMACSSGPNVMVILIVQLASLAIVVLAGI
jgi:hypothetical protein